MSAENVLLLPGMMCDERLWHAQATALSQTVFYGDTVSTDNFVDMAAATLEIAPDRFAMVGLSMGGLLAFEIWRQAPERVSHLALLDTNPHAEPHARKTMRREQIEAVRAGALRELMIESLKPLYLAESHREDTELLDTILDMALELGPEVFQRQSLAVRDRIDSVPTLASINCPTLVLCGREDTLCPIEYHTLMADVIPNAKLRVVDDCGHLSSLEQPSVVTDELEQLLHH